MYAIGKCQHFSHRKIEFLRHRVTEVNLGQHFDQFRFAIDWDLVCACNFENAPRKFAAAFRRDARCADTIPGQRNGNVERSGHALCPRVDQR